LKFTSCDILLCWCLFDAVSCMFESASVCMRVCMWTLLCVFRRCHFYVLLLSSWILFLFAVCQVNLCCLHLIHVL
jgi:hypothetical protein